MPALFRAPAPEDCESQNQKHQDDHHKDVEQDAGDIGGRRRNAGKAEQPGND